MSPGLLTALPGQSSQASGGVAGNRLEAGGHRKATERRRARLLGRPAESWPRGGAGAGAGQEKG